MPVTRSSSRQASQRPASPYLSRRTGSSGNGGTKTTSKSPSNEIIILSSDDDEPPPKGTSRSRKSSTRTAKRKAAPPIHSGEVLEISSDEEIKPKKLTTRKQGQSSETTNIKELERTIKKLKEELKRNEQTIASSCREIENLQRDCTKKNKDVLSGLDEHMSCEVCTLTMWCPYTLPECGHSFCESCLIDWFGTTQAQHITANPQLDNNRAALAGQLHAFVQMVPNLHAYGLHGQQHVRAVLAELRRHRPQYTCPSCRKEVLSTPVEDFRLKALIGQIAGMMGETNSKKEAASHPSSGPFNDFFAAPVR